MPQELSRDLYKEVLNRIEPLMDKILQVIQDSSPVKTQEVLVTLLLTALSIAETHIVNADEDDSVSLDKVLNDCMLDLTQELVANSEETVEDYLKKIREEE